MDRWKEETRDKDGIVEDRRRDVLKYGSREALNIVGGKNL